MKYIIFEDFAGDQTPIIFPERIHYDEMREQMPYSRVLSAGYVVCDQGTFLCNGEVKELNTRSRQEDNQIIARHFHKNF
jgi:hypothetical protein